MTQGGGGGGGDGGGGGSNSPNQPPKIALTIAGSDSGGGAGIQADLKTFHQFGVFGTSVIVAVTAQNTRGVRQVHTVPVEMVRSQMSALAEDLPPRAIKTGMLATAELVSAVAAGIEECDFPNVIVDPVMVATSGDRLLSTDAESSMIEDLVPQAALVTPNLSEAQVLAGCLIKSESDMESVGRTILDMGAGAVLVKGYTAGSEVVDLLVTPDGAHRFSHAKLPPESTHGTGCTLSAAIAAGLAKGADLVTAVAGAIDFVHRAIASAPPLGAGHRPLNHFVTAPSPK